MRSYFKGCLFIFLLSIIPFLNQFSIITLVFLCFLLFLSIILEKKKLILSRFYRIIFVIVFLSFLYFELESLRSLEAGTSLLSFLAILKIFEIKEKRDLYVFTLIIELSMIGHLLSVDDLYMILIILMIISGIFWLVYKFQNIGEEDSRIKNNSRDKQIETYKRKVFIYTLIWSIPLAISLFFVFPRFPLGNIFHNTLKKNNITGFSEHLRPGEINKVIQSKQVYFRVKFQQLRPSPAEFYWRGVVLAHTDGFNWDRVHLPIDKRRGQLPQGKDYFTFSNQKTLYSYEINYENFSNGPLYLLDRLKTYKVLSRSHTVGLGADTFYSVPYRNEKIHYQATAVRRNRRGHSQNIFQLSESEKMHYLVMPKNGLNPEFSNWINDNREQVHSAQEGIKLFENYFNRHKFKYSLSPGLMNTETPLDDFFFNKRVGLCEHYASTLAIGLRAFGIPSRVVVGFQGGQYNPFGEYFLIEGKNAHSWVEYWSPKQGWQRVDPTFWIQPNRILLGANSYFRDSEANDLENEVLSMNLDQGGVFQSLKLMADMIYFELNREFLNYDFEKQTEIFKFMSLEGKFKYLKLILLLLMISVLIMVVLIFSLNRQKTRGNDLGEKITSELRQRMKALGMDIPLWWGPIQIEMEVIKRFPEKREVIHQICSSITLLRYKRNELNAEANSKLARRQLKSFLKTLRQELKRL